MHYQIVIPVMDESKSVMPLVKELEQLNDALVVDFIDDSKDSRTVAAIATTRAQVCNNVTIEHFHRQGADNQGGLAGAVIDGIQRSSKRGAQYVIVMDGDGQHDPASIPAMLEKLDQGYDIVASTRYASGGSSVGLDGPWRHFVSRSAAMVAKMFFPMKLKAVSDPGAGFFAFKVSSIDLSLLNAVGFKILFEILVSQRGLRIGEVPVVFRPRKAGESKGTVARGLEFLVQLARLRLKYWMLQPGAQNTTVLESSAP
jgi:glycosyltransferase involved in cell wall biosynthesis